MQIIATTAGDVKPTHFVECMANCLKAKEIHERLGAESLSRRTKNIISNPLLGWRRNDMAVWPI